MIQLYSTVPDAAVYSLLEIIGEVSQQWRNIRLVPASLVDWT
jgi:hypothetical protein